MSFQNTVALRKNLENDGSLYQHNFRNSFTAPEELKKPSKEVAQQIQNYTKDKLSTILYEKASTIQGTAQSIARGDQSQYIKYTPKDQGLHNSGANTRIIKMQMAQSDPIEPKGYKHKKIPKGPGSPPATVVHSPPRKLTAKDMADWKIPPCISNWKNAKGYTLPLEYRISADGRTLQTQTINDKFAQVSDAYYLAERQARQEIEERNKIGKSLAYKEYLKKEEQMRQAAANAREDKNKLQNQLPSFQTEESEEYNQRQQILYMRKRELESEQRLEYAGKNKAKAVRDKERDISEQIALGQAQPSQQTNEALFDQRLFNQNAGLQQGFGDDDEYNVYTKPLFQDRTAANIYQNLRNVPDEENEDTQVEQILTKQPNRGFEGALQQKQGRNKPVEFEKNNDEIFGMDSFIEKKKVKKE